MSNAFDDPNAPMEFPTPEEIAYFSLDSGGLYFDSDAMRRWGIPTKNPPTGWAVALRHHDTTFFRQHGIHVRRSLIPKSFADDDFFVWK